MELSKRLQAVADMVCPGSRVCDIGCDHGYVSIYLVYKKVSPFVIAMDVNEGPLLRAREHIAEWNLENYIETRLSDGMQAFHMGEADTVICAGMGGRLMQKILTEGQQKVEKLQDMILQPQSEISLFRKFLRQQGYTIVQENMIWEEGKFYPMMRVVPYLLKQATDTVPSELADKFGGHLLMQRHPVLAQYLQYKKEEYRQILTGLTAYARNTGRQADRRKEILSELQEIEAAEKYMSERVR